MKLRLKRMGRAKRPFYRIVAADVTTQRDGLALGELGTYDPMQARVDVNAEAAIAWLDRGAQMTETVRHLLQTQGVLARWRGLEGKVREDALKAIKPKRRKKLAAAAKAAETPAVEGGSAAGGDQA